MEWFQTAYGEGRCRVTLEMRATNGHGLYGLLGGGELTHVGGVVLAAPRAKSSGEGLTSNLWIITVPDHKDINIGQQIAHQICVRVNEAVSLTVGLHIDHATAEEIQTLCDNCRAAAELFAAQYLAQKEG